MCAVESGRNVSGELTPQTANIKKKVKLWV